MTLEKTKTKVYTDKSIKSKLEVNEPKPIFANPTEIKQEKVISKAETFEVKPTAIYNGNTDNTMTSDYILSHKNEFIGKMLAIKFYERTDKNIPFNANAYGVRDYESND